MKICGTCKFWSLSLISCDGEFIKGVCRRNPPILHPKEEEFEDEPFGVWPCTVKNEWCGEYKPKEEQNENSFENKRR